MSDPRAPARAVPGYSVSTDPGRIDVAAAHAFLTEAYWCRGISRETLERAVRGSAVCAAVFDGAGRQVAFSRAVSDAATFAYVADVYVLEEHRGRGLAEWMLAELLAHPSLRGLRRRLLATKDAHGLYGKLGFVPLRNPERWMELPAR